ncbi:MAG: HAD-IIA family hydrolase [Clostridia bacterium]|nr:HAD-IIA family hydrolase [Clostridia bacterium]
MNKLRAKKGYICDMDGVIYHGNRLLDGVKQFVEWLYKNDKQFLFLTNNSQKSPRELQQKLKCMGLDVDQSNFYTSAMATASFLSSQAPNTTAYVIGDSGLLTALHQAGIDFNDVNPEYVVIGETNNYNFGNICKATQLVNQGAKLIGTNSDVTGPAEHGIVPACKALIAPIEIATERKAYFVGKPNPLMMRAAMQSFHNKDIHSQDVAMIGDRMDTDIIAGIESGLDSILVLSGVSTLDTVKTYPYRPRLILQGVGDIAME